MEKKLVTIEAKADKNADAIATLTATVKNGLSSRVTSMDNRMWAITGGVVAELIGIILLLVFQ